MGLTIFSIFFLDRRLTLIIEKYYPKTNVFFNLIVYIPNLILYLAGFISAIMIILNYFSLRNKLIYIIFLVSYSNFIVIVFTKALKMFFSRTGPKYWLNHQNISIVSEFSLCKIGNVFREFPSGHSASIAAICAILYSFFPKYQKYFTIIIVIVSFSLLIRQDHYLSSILIGNMIGFSISKKLFKFFQHYNFPNSHYELKNQPIE